MIILQKRRSKDSEQKVDENESKELFTWFFQEKISERVYQIKTEIQHVCLKRVLVYRTHIMKKLIFIILGSIAFLGAFFSYFKIETGSSYEEYSKLWDYRRLHPELLPSPENITLSTAGHTHTYADKLWIDLIQYIGDNIGNGKYLTYINPLISTISTLHPHFTRTYTLALLMAPVPNEEKTTYQRDLKIAQEAYVLGKK